MNNDLEKIDNYYIGFIQLNPFVYNRETARRMIDEVNYDPFCEVDIISGMIEGAVVLLRKEENIFYDEYSSRYRNEIKLELGKTDKHGIKLSYVKKFTDVYKEEPTTLIKEEVEKDYNTLERLLLEHDYYISHSILDKTYVPITLDNETRMYDVREEYFDIVYRQPLEENKYQK